MKKGNSKNRHFSKGINKFKKRKESTCRKVSKRRTAKRTNLYLEEESLKWNRIGTAIQLADFLIDHVPRLVRWLFSLIREWVMPILFS